MLHYFITILYRCIIIRVISIDDIWRISSFDFNIIAGELIFFVKFIHRHRELFAYSTPTEVVPSYLALVVNCFVVGSVDVGDLRVVEWLEATDD